MGRSAAVRQERNRKVEAFRQLHHSGEILVLPCECDVATAKVFEALGYPAIETTSAGIAASLGYPDGQKIDFDQQLDVARRMARHLRVLLTVDIEAGYADTIEDVTRNVEAVVALGAVGINIEDENHSRHGGFYSNRSHT